MDEPLTTHQPHFAFARTDHYAFPPPDAPGYGAGDPFTVRTCGRSAHDVLESHQRGNMSTDPRQQQLDSPVARDHRLDGGHGRMMREQG